MSKFGGTLVIARQFLFLKATNKLDIRSIEIKQQQKMLDFDFNERYMKEEKEIASTENNKGY